ncbi:DUF4291 domain-containing protein [Fibrella aestuarina]|uniref:DUF4291 domain-containing protein n=1 Tax=Fibrella aestuarina TaxID=651143 RepID=UPI00059C3F28|nr:DUF4291 domain-containing protein [Fibrella aestuarina]
MNLRTVPYNHSENALPQEGCHILGQLRGESIIVYQAYSETIARYAVQHQCFGGPAYSFNRMSWIKPNFLWMMYRAGWASKVNQERILAIEVPLNRFVTLLEQAVYSSYQPAIYPTIADWQAALALSDVRLQWDPDHDPWGNRLARRAIQLGLRSNTLKAFATEWILSIEDITGFVKEQSERVATRKLTDLIVVDETPILIPDPLLSRKLKLGQQ